ncbi:MAG: RNA ligase (ATP) [Rectinemataceae bacterium]|nr:RNA ligase (ATP) [Rectinemataceae bacterium]
MSTFQVHIKRILAIESHPNADAIALALIDGYRSIVKKEQFRPGDLVAYIPEASLLPDWLLQRMGFWDDEKQCGKLHGRDGRRVKAIKLRGELSQGICYPVSSGLLAGEMAEFPVMENDNVIDILGITKWEPPIPISMAGELFDSSSIGIDRITLAFDIENWKAYPDILQEGEEVVFTEKIHGTFTGITLLPPGISHPEAFGCARNILIWSKGLGAKGLVFKNNEANAGNAYVRATAPLIACLESNPVQTTHPLILMGETFGHCVQDLSYGETLGFRLFAAVLNRKFADFDDLQNYTSLWLCASTSLVPILYRGPFSEAVMREYTDGKTTLGAHHLREGIVMTPVKERFNSRIGRVCLKSISADYLLRKGGTEFN